MFRKYLGLVSSGLGISITTNAVLNHDWIVAALFAVFTIFLLVIGWFDLRDMGGAEADLAEAEADIDELLTQASEHASDAGAFFHALTSARDHLRVVGGEREAMEVIEDALAHTDNRDFALRFHVNALVTMLHEANKQWWIDPATGEDVALNPLIVPTKLLLVISEVCEGMEAHRKNLPDDKLPELDGLTVELADALIRICDLAGKKRLRLGDATAKKVTFNAQRPDHTAAGRLAKNGKAY
ncbi:hypothetical protein [Rhodopseudomonas palustris]|uniref:hypothetical protein n=1 Tax=Rhodopseudomonas palustris TaxID=1076 RepID=UPI00069A180A|nr:hypothetical protein [Rhodopseudomonas palustris]